MYMSGQKESDKNWLNRADCRKEDPELFFPIGNTGPSKMQIEQARAVCNGCAVIDTCLKWALETNQDHGVWGGLSEDERRAVKRRGQRQRQGQYAVRLVNDEIIGLDKE